MSAIAREGVDFFPLSVDYEEKLYAAGRIPGSFMRREGRPSEASILIARVTDRPLRPLFPDDMRNEVQVIVTPLSHDQENHADMLSIIAASAALTHLGRALGRPDWRGARRHDRRRVRDQPDHPARWKTASLTCAWRARPTRSSWSKPARTKWTKKR